MAHEKRYTEEEARAIFKRAAERHDEARRAEESSRAGLTLKELQRIGAEAGIDPEHVAAATTTDLTRSAAPNRQSTFLGIPTSYQASHTIPVDISDEAWETIVPELRRIFRKDGTPGQFGRVRTWKIPYDYFTAFGPVNVTLSPEKDKMHVKVEKSQKYNVYSLLALIVLICWPGIFAAGSGLSGLLAVLLGGTLLFGAFSFGMRLYFRNMKEKFERVFDRIELIARKFSRKENPTEHTERTRPQVDLDALPDEPKTEQEVEQRDRGRTT